MLPPVNLRDNTISSLLLGLMREYILSLEKGNGLYLKNHYFLTFLIFLMLIVSFFKLTITVEFCWHKNREDIKELK